MTQPEALRLADSLELDPMPMGWCDEAAAELRRLHAENERCRDICAATSEGWRQDAEAWEAQRDALLEALKEIAAIENQMFGPDWEEIDEAREIARAAIKAVEEGK